MSILFISRGTMSGVYQLVKCLVGRTGIREVSHEDLTKIVNRHGELATRVMQQLDGAISAYDQFSRLRWPYWVLMRQALLEEVLADNMVYHGYSAHFLLPTLQHSIKVRIDAPLDLRVKMTMKRLDCDEKAARDYITRADDERVRWARFMYYRDVRDPKYYDLHINLGHMSLDAICGILDRAISEKEFQTLPETRAEVERLFLAASVEAALVTDPRTYDLEIGAKVEGADVYLSGPYLADRQLATVTEIVAGIAGVEKIRYAPGYAATFGILHGKS
ncbi:cytidylate kinase family protein [Desulforhabdus amnigena]|uniref:Cytidylate kinase-like family protein n=1 Tax=Desulforhabdus amnigena TaxID=40218 RepID=A0A9W6FSJ2_9BACT|nr:cytidylate kinase family protein [Desulforhabdus amnigena]GLI34113.1 hypothetical protein DAMNIGENAA_15460 [Desulforhabdus amnigena]